VADSENVHCCRCSDRICWRLVSNERLEALDVRLAAFVSEEGRVSLVTGGWASRPHTRSAPTFAHCVSPAHQSVTGILLPVGTCPATRMIWDSDGLLTLHRVLQCTTKSVNVVLSSVRAAGTAHRS
jgi:hypothetical protein